MNQRNTSSINAASANATETSQNANNTPKHPGGPYYLPHQIAPPTGGFMPSTPGMQHAFMMPGAGPHSMAPMQIMQTPFPPGMQMVAISPQQQQQMMQQAFQHQVNYQHQVALQTNNPKLTPQPMPMHMVPQMMPQGVQQLPPPLQCVTPQQIPSGVVPMQSMGNPPPLSQSSQRKMHSRPQQAPSVTATPATVTIMETAEPSDIYELLCALHDPSFPPVADKGSSGGRSESESDKKDGERRRVANKDLENTENGGYERRNGSVSEVLPPGWERVHFQGKAVYLDHILREAHHEKPWVVWRQRAASALD